MQSNSIEKAIPAGENLESNVLTPLESNETNTSHGTTASPELHAEPHTSAHSGVHVALKAETITSIWGIPITNTLVTSLIISAALITFAIWLKKKLTLVPGRAQLFMEEVFTYLHNFIESTLEDAALARKYFPLLATTFLFIALCNVTEFIPGIGSLGFFTDDHGFVPLFRSVNTDLNVTLALTLIVVFVIEMAGILMLGLKNYAHKFINFSSPVGFFVGLVELVSELARVVSFSFRLFGNIFAGEVLIAVVTFFVPYVLPVPLMAFEMFVGIVQAAIFTLLTLFFIKLAITEAH